MMSDDLIGEVMALVQQYGQQCNAAGYLEGKGSQKAAIDCGAEAYGIAVKIRAMLAAAWGNEEDVIACDEELEFEEVCLSYPGRIVGLEAQLAEVAAALPGSYFMDPPDGGDVSIAEQVRRMAHELEHVTALHCNAAKQLDTLLDTRRKVEFELTESRDREAQLAERLEAIGDYAHDRSTGPAVWDPLWEIRSMAYEGAAIAAEQEKNDGD